MFSPSILMKTWYYITLERSTKIHTNKKMTMLTQKSMQGTNGHFTKMDVE